METTFNYSKYVVGRSNIGREPQTRAFANLLTQGENVSIYEPPKTGKMSLIQQAYLNLKSIGLKFIPITVNLLNIRSLRTLVAELVNETLRPFAQSATDYSLLINELLSDSHIAFDESLYLNGANAIIIDGELSRDDIRAAFSLPYILAKRRGIKIFFLLNEFQNIMLTEDGEGTCRILEKIFTTLTPDDKHCVSYIFCGSSVNAMHQIFGIQKWFYRQNERIELPMIETKLIIEHILRGLQASGKVIDRDLMLGACKLFRNNIWYINHFASICDSLTRGYIMEPTLNAALQAIIAVHEPRFISIMNNLTSYQVNMLKAILDGVTQLTSSEVIANYGFNSSANVFRLKEALSKKEIVSFDMAPNPVVIDPLFEYWAKTVFFSMKI